MTPSALPEITAVMSIDRPATRGALSARQAVALFQMEHGFPAADVLRPSAVRRPPRPGNRVRPLGPEFPLGDQGLNQSGLGRRQIVQLGAVLLHVVQFPLAGRRRGHELPLADANRPISLVLPVDRVALDRPVGERRHEALALPSAESRGR